jgi:hypothetical protein
MLQNTPQPVPERASVRRIVQEKWLKIHRQLHDGVPFDVELQFIDDILARRRQLVQTQRPDRRYDWTGDLAEAEATHYTHRALVEHNRYIRERGIKFWLDRADRNRDYLQQVRLNGLKTILIIHGAVAIGALGVLTQKSSDMVANTVLAAKIALICALMGMFMLGIGQVLILVRSGPLFERIAAKASRKIRWSKVRAFNRYLRRYYRPVKFGDYLIYGSVFWFGLYSFWVYLILIS